MPTKAGTHCSFWKRIKWKSQLDFNTYYVAIVIKTV